MIYLTFKKNVVPSTLKILHDTYISVYNVYNTNYWYIYIGELCDSSSGVVR